MKKISKARVLAFLKEREAAGDPVQIRPQTELKALAAAHQGAEFFMSTTCSPVQAVEVTDQTGEAGAEAVTFAASLKGSKWEAHVSESKGSFVSKEYRMLSQTWVNTIYNFGYDDGKALREAQKAGKFDDKKFYKDHRMSVDAVVGVVGVSSFDESKAYPVPGVNNTVFVDRRLDEPFAMRFESELVDSVSVGINFKKTPTHSFEDPWDFWMLLGQEVDGERVGFNVTEIVNIVELSSVYDGADPYAKVKGSFSADGCEDAGQMAESEKDEQEITAEQTPSVDTLTALEALAAEYGDTITKLNQKADELQAEVDRLTAELEDSRKVSDKYEQFVTGFGGAQAAESLIKAGSELVASKRDELICFMNVTGKSAFTSEIAECKDVSKILSLHRIFKSDIDASIPLNCPNCKTNVLATRQQSADFAQPVQVIHVADMNKEDADAVSKFCHDIHN